MPTQNYSGKNGQEKWIPLDGRYRHPGISIDDLNANKDPQFIEMAVDTFKKLFDQPPVNIQNGANTLALKAQKTNAEQTPNIIRRILRTVGNTFPMYGAMSSGFYGKVANVADASPVLFDGYNKIIETPYLKRIGLPRAPAFSRGPGAEFLEQMAQDLEPETAKLTASEAKKQGKLAEWAALKLAKEAPQIAASFATKTVRTPLAIIDGLEAAGESYQSNKKKGDSTGVALADAAIDGGIAAGTGLLEINTLKRVGKIFNEISAVQGHQAKDILRDQIRERGPEVVSEFVNGGIKNVGAQLAKNASDKFVRGDDQVGWSNDMDSALFNSAIGTIPAGIRPTRNQQFANAIDEASDVMSRPALNEAQINSIFAAPRETMSQRAAIPVFRLQPTAPAMEIRKDE